MISSCGSKLLKVAIWDDSIHGFLEYGTDLKSSILLIQ